MALFSYFHVCLICFIESVIAQFSSFRVLFDALLRRLIVRCYIFVRVFAMGFFFSIESLIARF
jgi:hypothetical protein